MYSSKDNILDEKDEDSPEEIQDILKSIGALGEQVKNEKSKANENKKKGYAKAKAISKKYG
tara:strand:+ start:87 stop:269 length:183 start_codon:yes stop_codon:yes gene_type:complete